MEFGEALTSEDLLFPSISGGKLNGPAVNAIVKRIAAHAELKGRYTGATAALQGGMAMEQIRAIGGWESKAVLLYLRSIAAANNGASFKMGL